MEKHNDAGFVGPVWTLTPTPTLKPTLMPTLTPTTPPTMTPVPTETPTPTPTFGPDYEPPVISGVQPIVVAVGGTVSYKRGVEITDNSGGDVELIIDNSTVDLSKPGEYDISYTAIDHAGNTTIIFSTVTVKDADVLMKETEANRLADKVIAEVISDDMTEWQKIYKLWQWVRSNVKYTYTTGDMTSEYTGAYEGLHDGIGDCYSYYATYKILLDKAGIQNLKCTRVGGESDHYWNLVMYEGKWYHCDASPRRPDDPFHTFLQTDLQIKAYTESYPERPNYYTTDWDAYPERATVPVYDGWTHKRLKSGVVLTKTALLAKIEELKTEFPAGTYWNGENLGVTDVPCENTPDHAGCNYYHGPSNLCFEAHNAGWQCLGFASLLSDKCFGEDTSAYIIYDYDQVRIGDQVRMAPNTNSPYHSAFIIDKTDEYIVVAECNRDFRTCLIEWGRVILKTELDNMDVWYITRSCEIKDK
ncbi:MAG: transglutaminase domain-containing protein [Lachnospiraceae bacterium]|nr:transglutaminase domain-containing protein [Lachnospiraceae bacterium]